MTQVDLPQKIKQQLEAAITREDVDAQINVRRTSLGWLHLSVTSTEFAGKAPDERERFVDDILEPMDLSLSEYPFVGYQLLTPQEADEAGTVQPIQLPLWSEILMAPEPDSAFPLDNDTSRRPLVVTFYSFKGGVGRSTALGFVANILATRGHKVVMMDFDLEAPGLSFMYPTEESTPKLYGVLDYIYQRYLTPDENQPTIEECIRQIDIPVRGELYLVPAGEYNEGYIHRLADLDIRVFYQRETNPIHQLLNDVKTYLDPDIILIDARTGFTEMGAIALFDQADLGIICFSPTPQSFSGLEWVVKAASKQRSYRGIPDLRFLLTPMPPVAQSQQQIWASYTSEWIVDHWEVPPSLTVEELYYQVPYNPTITTLEKLFGDLVPGVLEPYIQVADAIAAGLPETPPDKIKLAEERPKILEELLFHAATAQEMNPADIPEIFQRTGDFSKFLHDRTWLVRGAKGTGKTLLFRLFVELPNDARSLAQKYIDLTKVDFIPGHGQANLRNTLLTSTDLTSYEQQAGESSWPLFWLNYVLLQLVSSIPKLQSLPDLDPELVKLGSEGRPQHAAIVDWLVQRAKVPQHAPRANDELLAIDEWLKEQDKRVWVLYDELDVGFGQSKIRRNALEALAGWWVENGSRLTRIVPKILLREDIWTDLNFTNKTYFSSCSVQLRWEESDLWRLVLRQSLGKSPTLANLIQQEYGIDRKQLDNTPEQQLRRSLYLLWGERMGRSRKAYTYNWIRNRISDSKNNRFPRSLIQLLQRAVDLEKQNNERSVYQAVLRPRTLIEALPFVSRERVAEVRNEYPEFADYLGKLAGQRSPITLEKLGQNWRLSNDELNVVVTGLIEAGVLQEYTRSPDSEIQRYSVAELYLYGLGMTRQGQR
ncbi:MAG: AAA family ATPase [Chloroflexota bacterium]|nr:AAA family ATPase [Chloroflexota bacterium]